MAVLKSGSSGSAVSDLQKKLNAAGYNLTVDGIYGAKTTAAVKDYQSKNGLSADGIYGSKTAAALSGASTATKSATTTKTAATTASPTTTAKAETPYKSFTGVSDTTNQNLQRLEQGFTPSADTQAAMDYLKSVQQQAPGQYQSQYDAQIQDIYNQIVNRDQFNYDVTGDQLYQMYKDQAVHQGQLAMRDSMGQAAALNGGYGSTYGQAVGQQTYNEYLNGLNDIVPELYNSAYNRYQQEGDELLNQYNMLNQQENQAYDRYTDDLNRYYADLENAQNRYDSSRDYDYDQYLADQEYWMNRAEMENKDYWDVYAAKRAEAAAAAAASASRSSGGGSSGGSSKSSGGSSSGSSSGSGKAPTEAMMDEVWSLYQKGGWNKAEDAMTRYEALGYNVTKLSNYVQQMDAHYKEKGYRPVLSSASTIYNM